MKLLKKTIALFIIITCILTLISPLIAQAKEIEMLDPNNFRTVTTDKEKRVLLGGLTADEAREEYLLGIASKFAVFVEDTFMHSYSDVGGKAAVGKKFESWNEGDQVGAEYYNYQLTTHDGSADVVLGTTDRFEMHTGQSSDDWDIAPFSSTKEGKQYNMKKLIAVPEECEISVPLNLQVNDWADPIRYPEYVDDLTCMTLFKGTSEDLFVKADLIDFEEEFEHLRTVSENLASMQTTGTIIESEEPLIVTNSERGAGYSSNTAIPGVVLRGENPFYNVFNITSEKWNSYDNILFDVPYDSYVIINIDGNNIIFSDVKSSENWAYHFSTKNIFYPISRNEILKDGLESKEPAYLIDRDNPVGDTVRDEEGYVKTYVKLLSEDEKNWDKGEYILYNLPNATSFTFNGNWVGTVLAPNATGKDILRTLRRFNYFEMEYWVATGAGGHLAGNLICKNYNGGQEFGNTLFSMPNSYLNLEEIEISKANSVSNANVAGATMRIRDLEGNVLYQWETADENKKVELPKGAIFILEEVNSPEGYTGGEPIAFQLDDNGNVVAINTSVNYKEIETVGTTYSNLTTSEAKNYINKTGINKVDFVPDTSSSATKTEWGLECTVGEIYYKHVNDSKYANKGIYVEDLKWTHTDDGETVTAYLPIYEVNSWNRGIINFYRGDEQVSDVKLKSLTTYSDKLVTKKTASGEVDYVETNGKTLIFYNTPETGIRINIDKVEKDSKVKVAGVGFGLYALEKNDMFEKDELVIGGVTDATGKLVLERYGIPTGKYYVKEMSTPSAYIPLKSTVEYSLREEIADLNIEIENEVAMTTVNVSKKFKGEDEPVKDVEFGVFAAEDIQDIFGNYIWKKDDIVYKGKTAEDGTIKIVFSKNDIYRPLGKYYLKEIDGPEYLIQSKDKYEFEILQNVEEYKFDVENDYTKLEITKVAKETGEPVVGAKLQIQNEAGEVIEEFTTTEKAHRIDKIAIGKYKLIETEAPAGYLKAEDIKFEVTEIAEVQTVEMEEDYTKLEIIKTDKETGEKVPGAKLQIQNEAGEVVEEFTTTENAHRIDKIAIGKYKLVETEAPAGYVKAEPVEFEVTETAEVQTVEMEEDYTKLEITKTDKETGEPVVGAKLQIQNEEGEVVEEFTTTDNAYRIDKLLIGKYKLVEIKAPEGYVIAEPVEFEIEETAEVQTVEMKEDYTKLEITKTDKETGEPIKGVKLQIQDSEGNVIEEWVTDGTPHKISKLPAGKYKIVVVEAPEGYLKTEDVEFEITQTAEIKEVNVESEKPNEEETEGKEDEEQKEPIKPEEQNKPTNPEKPEESEKQEETNKPEKPNTSDKKEETDKSESSAATGDNILSIIISLVVASMTLAISIRHRRKIMKN